jgi:hypothetical protein
MFNAGAEYGFDRRLDVCGKRDKSEEYYQTLAVAGNPACEHPPGTPNYCRDCGPCTLGEGDCDSDEDCSQGLVCAQDVGANLGYQPSTDVCIMP